MPDRILVVRLGAMGDILHALPAVASLRRSFPNAEITWVIAPKWKELLDGNPQVDRLLLFRRRTMHGLAQSWQSLRLLRPALAFDFQGLIQSALLGRAARPVQFWGWRRSVIKEWPASFFYSNAIQPSAVHVVDRNLELVRAAGANSLTQEAYIPQGSPEGDLPSHFVLVHPFAGWTSKQWPLENYALLANRLQAYGIATVANVAPATVHEIASQTGLLIHKSSLSGLIDATRRAVAIVGPDSGPVHLAAALDKPGVALFGPTDPARNGPYGGSLAILRAPNARTTYKRNDEIDPSMTALSVDSVYLSLSRQLGLAS